MKQAASLFTILIVVFVAGCQDNNMTGPTDASASKLVQLSKDEPMQSVALNAILHEPGTVYNSFLQISGSVTYQATVVPLDPIPPNPQFAVKLNQQIDAEVRPYEPGGPPSSYVWRITGASEDWVPIPESRSAFFTKRFRINGRNDAMLLILKLEVTRTSVELNRMWLELPQIPRELDGE